MGLSFGKYHFYARFESVWSDLTMKILPKIIGLSFNKHLYLKTTSGIQPYGFHVTIHLIWIRLTFFFFFFYKKIFKIKISDQ